jgi:hypothetical protein
MFKQTKLESGKSEHYKRAEKKTKQTQLLPKDSAESIEG